MARFPLGHRTAARTAALAVMALASVLFILTFGSPIATASPARECTVICSTCQPITFQCDDGGPGGQSTPVPGATQSSGGTPGGPAPTQGPLPTVIPPTGAPGGGYYASACGFVGSLCSTSYANTVYYVAPNGDYYSISYTCVGSCATATPPPVGTPPPPPYPCNTAPAIGGSGLAQPCASQWPGWDLSVSVSIPAVNLARNPWPRSLVGLPTQFCFASAPDSVEKFSAAKACPAMPAANRLTRPGSAAAQTGDVGEGGRVNYQLGVAWRRFTGSDPGYGTTPPFRSALNLDDRSWNGGSQVIPLDPGQCTAHTYETSSYGLPTTGEVWNPVCQDQTCAYPDRTLAVNRSCPACEACTCPNCSPAYSAFIQTWWWPEWTFKYDEYVCVHKTDDCEAGRPTDTCNGVAGQKHVRTCDRWGWRPVTEPWTKYDARRQGLPLPYLGSSRTNAAGMTPEQQVMTLFQYSPSVPVIEVQPVKK